MLIIPAAMLITAGAAVGQDTVYIGGSGQTSVEIDLGVLDYLDAPRRDAFGLRHPGASAGDLPPVTLRPPDDSFAATPPRPETVAPVEVVTRLEAPAASVTAATDVAQPEPAAPTTAAVEDMTEEERAAAVARNRNLVSATAFADEEARAIGNETAATSAATQSEPSSAEPERAEPQTEVAALQPAVAPTSPGETMQIIFAADQAKLPQAAKAPLATLAAALGQDDTLRLQLRAYAGGSDDSASHARRLSLSRALSVRSELIEQGVRSTRIDVRALGNKSKDGTSDRVDVILVKR